MLCQTDQVCGLGYMHEYRRIYTTGVGSWPTAGFFSTTYASDDIIASHSPYLQVRIQKALMDGCCCYNEIRLQGYQERVPRKLGFPGKYASLNFLLGSCCDTVEVHRFLIASDVLELVLSLAF